MTDTSIPMMGFHLGPNTSLSGDVRPIAFEIFSLGTHNFNIAGNRALIPSFRAIGKEGFESKTPTHAGRGGDVDEIVLVLSTTT